MRRTARVGKARSLPPHHRSFATGGKKNMTDKPSRRAYRLSSRQARWLAYAGVREPGGGRGAKGMEASGASR